LKGICNAPAMDYATCADEEVKELFAAGADRET
jgi:hypothetical protein